MPAASSAMSLKTVTESPSIWRKSLAGGEHLLGAGRVAHPHLPGSSNTTMGM